MILKIYMDRKHNKGWRLIDKVHEATPDEVSWCLARDKKGEDLREDERPLAMICAIRDLTGEDNLKEGAPTIIVNKNYRLGGYEIVFDYDSTLENFENEDDFIPVKVITVTYDNEDVKLFVTPIEPSSWLLNDNGGNVQRI